MSSLGSYDVYMPMCKGQIRHLQEKVVSSISHALNCNSQMKNSTLILTNMTLSQKMTMKIHNP